MTWEDDHQTRVAAFPPDVREAHRHSSRHRADLLRSTSCGCFYCRETFSPEAIQEWIDTDESGVGQTALCPKCGIDSVLSDASGFPIDRSFLERMNALWF